MLQNFTKMLQVLPRDKKFRVCVAAAEDEELLRAVAMAVDMGFVQPVLVGNAERLVALAAEAGLDTAILIPCDDKDKCAAVAVNAVRSGQADVLMKGSINTADYMRAILHRDCGLRSGSLLSTFAVYEVKEYHKLLCCTDSGINVAPDLEAKKHILENALGAMRKMGLSTPKVALLAANEMVHPKIAATVDAAALVEMAHKGDFGSCILEGPIAFDVAFDPHAAAHKGLKSNISGEVDCILAPNIETGNALGKSWLTFNKAKWAGVVLGATHPVVLGSRSDSAEVKINSIALACLLAQA